MKRTSRNSKLHKKRVLTSAKKKWAIAYCAVIILVVTVPMVGTILKYSGCEWAILNETELAGVSNIPDRPELTFRGLMDGSFQEEMEDYFTYNLYSRRTQTKLYNQLLRSMFHSTANSELLVGRDNYIFDRAYATAYFYEMPEWQKAALRDNIDKLHALAEALAERGIPLVVRMSPSKAEFYPEYLPPSYDRFLKMKSGGDYSENWYDVFREEIEKTDIPYYDGMDILSDMKKNGEVVFTKGGTHWSLAPMEKYINGLNAYMEPLIGLDLGRMTEVSNELKVGVMGDPADCDIWDICWNCFYAPPEYPSPNIVYSSSCGEKPIRVFTVGQSFSTILLGAIYNKSEQPVWDETDFSWYNSRVIHYPSELPWGVQISEKTDDFESYLSADVILIDFLQNGDGTIQFQFVDNLLHYLDGESE